MTNPVVNTELWERYRSGCEQARDELIEQHLGLVHHVARQMARSMAGRATLDELVSSGTTGLLLALERFDASRGLSFSTYATTRIRGAILDDLRKDDHVPRLVRRRARAIVQARELLERTLQRAPTEREVAQQLGISVETLWDWEAEFDQNKRIPLERSTSSEDTQSSAPATVELLADDRFGDIEELVNREQEVELLREAISELKEQEQVVLALYYFEELKCSEIGTILGVTESRVSQIRVRAIGQLRQKLERIRSYVA
jgi:RNA polymerase sigma factor for flagellar operon FliA